MLQNLRFYTYVAGCQPVVKVTYIKHTMLWTIFWILLILWLLGVVTSYTLGGFIHILLVIAVVVILIRIINGQKPVA